MFIICTPQGRRPSSRCLRWRRRGPTGTASQRRTAPPAGRFPECASPPPCATLAWRSLLPKCSESDTERKNPETPREILFLHFALKRRSTYLKRSFSRFQDPRSHRSHQAQVGFQVCVRPGSYKAGPQTLGHSEPLDPRFSNSEIEWITKEQGGTLLYGLLVRIEWTEQRGRHSGGRERAASNVALLGLLINWKPNPTPALSERLLWNPAVDCWQFSIIDFFFLLVSFCLFSLVVCPRTPLTAGAYGGFKEEQTLPALYVSDTRGRFLKKTNFSSTRHVCSFAAVFLVFPPSILTNRVFLYFFLHLF